MLTMYFSHSRFNMLIRPLPVCFRRVTEGTFPPLSFVLFILTDCRAQLFSLAPSSGTDAGDGSACSSFVLSYAQCIVGEDAYTFTPASLYWSCVPMIILLTTLFRILVPIWINARMTLTVTASSRGEVPAIDSGLLSWARVGHCHVSRFKLDLAREDLVSVFVCLTYHVVFADVSFPFVSTDCLIVLTDENLNILCRSRIVQLS